MEAFAVGIARYKMSELIEIAGTEERVFTEENFEGLTNTITKLQEGIRKLEGKRHLGFLFVASSVFNPASSVSVSVIS